MDIDKIIELGNNPVVIKMCEPSLAFHQSLQKWMVVRTITALGLLQKKSKKRSNKDGNS